MKYAKKKAYNKSIFSKKVREGPLILLLSDRKEADTVMTGICVGLKSTLIFFINSILCRIISGVAAFS